MRILIDIGHPAHVHYFRNFIKIMESKGHSFCIIARKKEMTHYLLDHYLIKYRSRGKGKDSLLGKILYLPYAILCLLYHSIKFRPDLFLSMGSMYAAQVSKLLNKSHITFDDTENSKFVQLFYKPFTDVILSPTAYKKNFRDKHIRFNGYMELCYLHPNHFKPDASIKNQLGLEADSKYCIIRFVKWKALHDVGHKGITLENKEKLIKEFSKYAKVFISSEMELPPSLKQYQIRIPYEKIHDAIYFATLEFGESATMASEAAVLGTPAIYIDNVGRGYTDEEQAKFNLVFNFSEKSSDQLAAIEKGVELLRTPNINEEWQKRKEKMLADKIDVTAFMLWFVENYPESFKIMKENPDYQYNFK